MTRSGVPKLAKMLSPDEMVFIASRAVRRKYRDGEIIHERGDNYPAMGIVIAGKIKLTYPSRDGHEAFSGLIHTDQNYGDAALVRNPWRPHRAIAIGETVIDHLDRAAYEQLLEQPAILRGLYVVASYRLSVALEMLDDMRMLVPEVRLARLLVLMHESQRSERLEFLQEDFAGMLGISNVTLAKSLRRLEQRGLVEAGYRHIRISDPSRLAAWVREEVPD